MAKRKVVEEKLYRGICHTRCYWLDTLWEPGDEYEGTEPLGKHFSEEGMPEPEKPPRTAADDPRSNQDLRDELKEHPNNFTAPRSWKRKQLWEKLRDLEMLRSRDAAEEDAGPKMNVTAAMAKKPSVKRKAGKKPTAKD